MDTQNSPAPNGQGRSIQRPVSHHSKSPHTTKNKGLRILLILVALCGLVLGSLAVAAMYINSRSEKVLSDALSNLVIGVVEGNPVATAGTVSYELKGEQPMKLIVNFNGKAQNESSETSANFTIAYDGKTYDIKSSAVILGEDELYFKFENLTKTLQEFEKSSSELAHNSSYLKPLATKIDNKWIRVSKADLEMYGIKIDDQSECRNALRNLSLSKDDQNQLKQLFTQNQFMVAGETLKSERIDGVSSFHYKLDFNNKAAEDFVTQVTELPSMSTIKQKCNLNEQTISKLLKFQPAASKSKPLTTKPVVELWVGKRLHQPTKLRVNSAENNIEFELNSTLSINSKNIRIEKPAESISASDLKAEVEKIMPTSTSR